MCDDGKPMSRCLLDHSTRLLAPPEHGLPGDPHIKMKVGLDVDEDIRRIEAVCAACPDAKLVLDANQGLSLEQAGECIRQRSIQLPVTLFEQPVAREDVEGFVALRRKGTIPLAADGSVRSVEDARR